MNKKTAAALFLNTLLLLAACAAYSLQAADNPLQTPGLQPVFHFLANANEPVIEYNLVHGMIEQPDPAPLLRVYGNGRVHVHIPAYMKQGGDYELLLNQVELNDLLRQLDDHGIMKFDQAAVMQEKHQLESARRAATGEFSYISDDTDTVIKVRLDQYQRTPASQLINGFNRQFVWRNLKQDAIRYPASQAISRAATAATMLDELCAHPGLQKLP